MLKLKYMFNYNETYSPSQRADLNLFYDDLFRYVGRKLKGIWLEEIYENTFQLMYVVNTDEDRYERKSVYIQIANEPLKKNPKISTEGLNVSYKDVPLFVAYLYNFTSFQQLKNSLIYLMHTNLEAYEASTNEYYELTCRGIDTVEYGVPYEFNPYLNGYDFELGKMASREETEDVRVFTNRIAQKIELIDGLQVKEVIHSQESEACYLHISHYLVPYRKMKISIRNHPLNTQSQMVFYLYNYTSYEQLEERLLETLRDFDWDAYNYSAYNYYDVTMENVEFKKVGEDLTLYTPEQLAYVESMRKERSQRRNSRGMIVHPNEHEEFVKKSQEKKKKLHIPKARKRKRR